MSHAHTATGFRRHGDPSPSVLYAHLQFRFLPTSHSTVLPMPCRDVNTAEEGLPSGILQAPDWTSLWAKG
jgi:hypothetical protein